MSAIDRASVRRHFSRAAPSYAQASQLQRDSETRLLENLDFMRRTPERILDLGAGIGRASAILKRRFPKAEVIALDLALPMLHQARRNRSWWRPFRLLAGDAQLLPLADDCVDLVYSNLCLQWCSDLPQVFDELRRVLRPEGLLTFSTFGPRTLEELRTAWATVDGRAHVSTLPDMPLLGDALTGAGFRDPVLDIACELRRYPNPRAVLDGLKAIGATCANVDRGRGLTTPRRMAQMLSAYAATAAADGSVGASFEIISALAFGPDPSQPRRTRSGAIASIPIEQLRGSRIRR